MKFAFVIFFLAWILLMFAVLQHSTDASEPAVLSGLMPYYLLSLAALCVLLVTWKGELMLLATISFFYEACIVALPYLKYTFIYGNVYDTMYHYALSERIESTQHLPYADPYSGFTTFHTASVATGLIAGLPLDVSFRFLLFVLTPLSQIAAFWVSMRVIRGTSTLKLAILSVMIARVPISHPGASMMAVFFILLLIALALEFWLRNPAAQNQTFLYPLMVLSIALVMTHHQSAFFAIFGFIGVGLLLNMLKEPLKAVGDAGHGLLLVGLSSLGFAYLWWRYYSGFTDLLRFIVSVVEAQTLGFQTPIGSGVAYYGLTGWLLRTLILYAQRGQTWVWTGLGLLISILLLSGRIKRKMVDSEAHALVFVSSGLFLSLWAVFVFIPYAVISPDRFFSFAFLLSPPLMALGMAVLYRFIKGIGRRLHPELDRVLNHVSFRTIITYLLLVLIFVEFTGQVFLGGLSAASSQYQYSQISFLEHYVPENTQTISNVAITNQLQAYAPRVDTSSFARQSSTDVLYAIYSGGTIPPYAHRSLIIFHRTGPAGTSFEALSYFSNATWVPIAASQLLAYQENSLIYNSGESYIAWFG